MGHALNDTIQDTCIRRARMQGRPARWILGTDHAGISTQTKVDKKLADQGISRLEIGREAFVEACYDWYKEYGTTIVNQIKGMGCSCDYDDEHFTLEPAYVKAVREALRGLVPRRPHLQGQAHRELVPALHHVHLR